MGLAETFADFRRRLPRRPRLYVGGCAGEPAGLAAAMQADPDLAAGITFLGAWVPGINKTDWAGLHADARAETTFLPPAWRASYEAGRTRILPLPYSATWDWIRTTPLDAAVLLVSPPDANGEVSLGVSPDFGPALLGRTDLPILALVNPAMPDVPFSIRAPLSRFAATVEDDTPLVEVAPAQSASVIRKPPWKIPPAVQQSASTNASILTCAAEASANRTPTFCAKSIDAAS